MAAFVKFEVPEKLMQSQLAFVEKISKNGKVKIGVNEVTKTIERGASKLVIIAEDVEPAEIVMHLPLLCKEKKTPFTYVKTKKELGSKVGIEVGTAAVSVTDEGEAKKELQEITKKLIELSK